MSKKKIKVIRPTLRHKKTYIVLKYLYFKEDNSFFCREALLKDLRSNFSKMYGLFDLINSNITILEVDNLQKKILVRINTIHKDKFINSLFLNSNKSIIKVLDLQNTIKKCKF